MTPTLRRKAITWTDPGAEIPAQDAWGELSLSRPAPDGVFCQRCHHVMSRYHWIAGQWWCPACAATVIR